MNARLLAYLPDRPAVARLLDAARPTLIGRAPGCDLHLEHPSVSRRHAELRCDSGGWRLRDLDSKNGSFLDGRRVEETAIPGHAWLRFGDVLCEFEPLSEIEAAQAARRQAQRREDSIVFATRLQAQTAFPDLLQDTLRAVCELADCERGFLLLAEDGGLRVRATHALDPARLAGREFSGSIGVVERAIAERRPVVLNEVGADPQFAGRASVIAGGLQALLCLPLLDGERVLGAVYADSRRPGAAITELDMELLQAVCERAALWIAAHRDARALANLVAPPRWDDILAAHAGHRG
ncbi:GAF domain-containing protein [Rehaibacterium terrae]|jgi:hypothetical protein|uniref:FHA domain-containing protein n=1 Tax=Rehaibacterium terrae TaxID=1341696 RepID=A0A7W7Y0A1_9GAMM|nr:GAF domain-containing protein [Rehaibacterium terrae]MBB5015697.1 hypothetical protein [Rehaibacterium terrae]